MDYAKFRKDVLGERRGHVMFALTDEEARELIAVVDAARTVVNEAFRTSGRLEAETAGDLAKALHKLGA